MTKAPNETIDLSTVVCPKNTALKTLNPLRKYAAVLIAAALAGCGDDSEDSLMNAHMPTPPVVSDEAGDAGDLVETGSVVETGSNEAAQNGETGTVPGKADAASDGQGPVHYECGTLTNCSEKCVDTAVDTANCGSCGTVCDSEKPYCSNGGCTQCPDGLRNCQDGQGCIDFNHNDKNCGGCGNSCDPGKNCIEGNCQ